ncbi:MAG: xanthine dehydrogenase accessory protein XdhC [Burkholderiales bacterium]|nr:xanthine dehydrogenase accessory protein XdhC [Burkholderiales bacterium]
MPTSLAPPSPAPFFSAWLQALQELHAPRRAVLISVGAVRGSAPRAAGTRMLVTERAQYDSIGGGHLEWKALAMARLWLAQAPGRQPRTAELALGPSLGQCCGGAVQLTLERVDAWDEVEFAARLQRYRRQRDALPQLYLFGAGHVGTALVQVLRQVPCNITWVDQRDQLFPPGLPEQIQTEATDSPEAVIAAAAAGAYFLVMTHHHGLDLLLSEHILRRNDAAWFGLIGSKTKRARFEHRLRERGIPSERLDAMACPIGLSGIAGKEPGVIAVAVAAQLLQRWSASAALAANITESTTT